MQTIDANEGGEGWTLTWARGDGSAQSLETLEWIFIKNMNRAATGSNYKDIKPEDYRETHMATFINMLFMIAKAQSQPRSHIRCLYKQSGANMFHRILFSPEKEGNDFICKKINVIREQRIKQNKIDSKTGIRSLLSCVESRFKLYIHICIFPFVCMEIEVGTIWEEEDVWHLR